MSNAYRDDEAPLRERIEQLQREQETIRARAKELRESVTRGDEIDREIAETQKRIDDLRGPAMEFERLRIASPCKANWDEMVGDERVRFCGSCQKNVYNLSGMRRDEATTLIKDRTGEICVRMYRRADGTVLTADCPVGSKKRNVRRLAVLAAGGGALALAGGGLWAREPTEQFMGGAIAVAPPEHEAGLEAEPEHVDVVAGGIEAPPVPSVMGSAYVPVKDPPPHGMGEPAMLGKLPRQGATPGTGTRGGPQKASPGGTPTK